MNCTVLLLAILSASAILAFNLGFFSPSPPLSPFSRGGRVSGEVLYLCMYVQHIYSMYLQISQLRIIIIIIIFQQMYKQQHHKSPPPKKTQPISLSLSIIIQSNPIQSIHPLPSFIPSPLQPQLQYQTLSPLLDTHQRRCFKMMKAKSSRLPT